MWYEIFKFELAYRMRRAETYVFFLFLLLFSIVGVDFIFQGAELGLMKKNAPVIIAKTMGALTGIFMLMVSMIMGVPVLRDFQYDTESLLFVNPITKRDYLLGRFLGSFTVLLFIFGGLLFGMMLGSQMSWHKEEEMLFFNALVYFQSFAIIVLPTLFFGACVFFVTGMLSKKMLIVYTQGIVVFVIFLLTKAISNEYLQGILDPFSLTTITQFVKDWEVSELNITGISLSGIILHNKLLWVAIGLAVSFFGYKMFSFSALAKKPKKVMNKPKTTAKNGSYAIISIPKATIGFRFKEQCIQLYELSKFYAKALLKETSFWAIVICGMIIILINSVNLGTVYGVDSYPATHFIIAELQEMSLYFFIIILLFYSGELIWKERNSKQFLLNDVTPISNLITLSSKFIALNVIYVVLMLSLILAGILFQISKGYYNFELNSYFSGFFIEIFPFLMLYTFIAFLFQVVSNNKFIGILLTLAFFIFNIASEFLGFNHNLYKFGGKPLGTYSDMNSYGHFLKPYLWVKAYWIVFGILLLIFSALIMNRGTHKNLWKRLRGIKHDISKPIFYFGISVMTVFTMIGCYIFYNTNVLNTYWTNSQEQNFRTKYEETLKSFEYSPQPKITDVDVAVELYPETRSYSISGSYFLKNTTDSAIGEIHIQKRIASHLTLKNVAFEGGAVPDSTYSEFDYIIYNLSKPLEPNKSIKMDFEQTYNPKGFENDNSDTELVSNGTFFNNNVFPTLGYNNNYELNDADLRLEMGLKPRQSKSEINDLKELINARSGGDSDGINLNIVIGTNEYQTAITSGRLVKKWTQGKRNYFHYKSDQPIINFYSIVSAEYEVESDHWKGASSSSNTVSLEIFYHENHGYNIDRMFEGMKASLTYFSKNFSPYQYDHLRIMETPRYSDFAQSLPGTITFSEALGFVLDIDDATDVDMAFYITAHEVAHQWFGMQVEAANVQGRNFILETLSQYAAIMVLKQQFSQEKVDQFLELQQEIYDRERKKAISEPSLALVENQDFVYYNKGAIAMYKLQELIGEERVNKALKRFIDDWRSHTGHIKSTTNNYVTSNELLEYLRAETPEDKKAIIYDLFEKNEPIELSKEIK